FSMFDAAVIGTRTDDDGNYLLSGLPCKVPLGLVADPVESWDPRSLGEVYLSPDDQRSPTISRLGGNGKKDTFERCFDQTLRDCRLANSHAMVLLFQPADDTQQFVDGHFTSFRQTPEAASFLPLQAQVGPQASADVAAFAAAKNWPTPAAG